MNALACLTAAEIRALIHWHADQRDVAALLADRAGFESHAGRIEELKRLLPERQYEATPA